MTLSPQELFDKVVRHLLTQKARAYSSDKGGYCMYRNPDGLKCAVGCLIPDELYKETLEGRGVEKLPKDVLEAIGLDDQRNLTLAAWLQCVHDKFYPHQWTFELRDLARRMNLSTAVVDKFAEKEKKS